MKIETLGRLNMFEATFNSSISPFSCVTLQVEVNFFNTLILHQSCFILHQWKFNLQNRCNSFRVFRAIEARSRRRESTRHARRRKARKKNKHTKQNTKPYLFLPLPWSHVPRTPRSLLSCFRSPVKRQKLKPVLQANESYVVNVNAEITTYPSNSYKGCLTEAYFLKCCFLKSFTTRNSTC